MNTNRPWFDSYPQGVTHQIDPNRYDSIVDLLEQSFEKFSDSTAFENMNSGITYRELDEQSKNFASYLQNELHLQQGDRIAIQLPNLLQYPIALFGALRAGLIVVNTNPLYTPRELEHQLNDSGAETIVVLSNFAETIEKVLSKTKVKNIIITDIGDMFSPLKATLVNFAVKYIKKMVPKTNLPSTINFCKALKLGKRHSFNKPILKINDLAFLQYTGGTTGVSKGAMLSHRNIIANMEQNCAWMATKLVENKETIITALPLYHIFALTVNCFTFLKYGAKNILITNPRDVPAYCKEIKDKQFTVMTGVNTLYNHMMNNQHFNAIDFSKLKISIGGGMALQEHVAKQWKNITKTPLAEGYGLTETSPVVCCNPIDGTERIGTIGLPFPSTDVIIVDDDDKEVEMGKNGEILVKGPQVMLGYWNSKEETEKVFFGDWLRTGDIGFMDRKGYITLVDRKKEMINVSGFNVYPNEIEEVITSHPKVLESGVIGIDHPKTNEAVKAYIVKKDESLTEAEIIEYCKTKLTAYKVPKVIEFAKDLPKSNIGKILRRVLKERHINNNK
ncbi:AMP-binding protein [Aureibacter tunicatorum]|uniref:Long-chain-fatty-acid--CoA ligase n=1 Tax=Aureibacter tunicatorum TaxID=866807 RepID=A0AAE3XPG4_9BACT|nr:AMP-binding protein [Aureibacter tunicatorum]MDR6239639.1 long-chain acyl-CoA synthetase [Aureibacter tunicatorum]BDD04115.1 long-chain-fatty-acid--CoA ligase [Aureibacter tunicatorum]